LVRAEDSRLRPFLVRVRFTAKDPAQVIAGARVGTLPGWLYYFDLTEDGAAEDRSWWCHAGTDESGRLG
jgi:hypothetical protein